VVSSTKNYYHWLSEFADPRVETWPMMSSPMPTLGLFFLYLFVANYGPGFMKTRKPLQLRLLLIAYNLYIAVLNLWITCELCYCSYKLNYRSFCQLVRVSNDPYVMRIANAIWWYYASKGIEFADTLFFILRKKDRQLTFLHKYHHSSMFIVWWTAVRFVPGGSAITPVVFNSFVHVLMYTYYGLSALGPRIQKFLWWKRYLTIIQLIQFFVGVSIGIHLITSGCQFTRWMQYVFSGYAFSFIILFGNFYLNEYTKKQQKQQNGSAKIKQT
jgi:elongation of very long chain fatty acids protein 4